MTLLRRFKALFSDRNPLRLLWHWAKAFVAAARYGFPARALQIIGITGTDGKTTTVAMTAHILHRAGIKTGAVSTSFYQIGAKTEENPTHKTSLSPFAMQRFLCRCVNQGCTTVVVEASSHGLVQHRLDFLWPAVAAITNTALEHLDYHGTMEQYRKDKGILFGMLHGRGIKVLNAEDETATLYEKIPSAQTVTYSSKRPATIHAEHIAVNTNGTTATIKAHNKEARLHLRIPGGFNVENALCAISCAQAVGIDLPKAAESLADFSGVPGRMERIDAGQPFQVFVDFTVSPQAYEQTLTTARSLANGGRVLVLTGSCGDRMREKRPMIGKIVSELSDVMVVTEDETITEDPERTIDDVWAGIDQSKTEAHKILDRREAITFLLKQAKPGDVVMLCGMGACTTMQTREGLREWDERKVARELIAQLH